MEWWKLFQEAFATNESLNYFECACGIKHYNVFNSEWTDDENKVVENEIFLIPGKNKQNIEIRDFPIGTFIYNGKEYVWYCNCIEHNEELIETWKWINRNGRGLVKIISMIKKYKYDESEMLLNEIRDIVK